MTRGTGTTDVAGMNNPLDAFQDANRNNHVMANVIAGNNIVTNDAGLGRKFAFSGDSRYEAQGSYSNAIYSKANINFLLTGCNCVEIKEIFGRLRILNNDANEKTDEVIVHSLNNRLDFTYFNAGNERRKISIFLAPGKLSLATFQSEVNAAFATAVADAGSGAGSLVYNESTGEVVCNGMELGGFIISGPGTALFDSNPSGEKLIDLSTPTIMGAGVITNSGEDYGPFNFNVLIGRAYRNTKYAILNLAIIDQFEDKLRGSSNDHTWNAAAQQYWTYRTYDRDRLENAAPLIGLNITSNKDPNADPNYPKWGEQSPWLEKTQTVINPDARLVVMAGKSRELILPLPTLLAQGLIKLANGIIQPQLQLKFAGDESLCRNTYTTARSLALDEIELYAYGLNLDGKGRAAAAEFFMNNTTQIPAYIDQQLDKVVSYPLNNFTQVQLPHMGRFRELSIRVEKKAQNYTGTGDVDVARINGVYPGLSAVQADEKHQWEEVTEVNLIDNTGSNVGLTDVDNIVSKYWAVTHRDYHDYINETHQCLLRFDVGSNCSWDKHAEDGGLWFEPTYSARYKLTLEFFNGIQDDSDGLPKLPLPGQYNTNFMGVKHSCVTQEAGYSNAYLLQ